jgi:hypothetical protein
LSVTSGSPKQPWAQSWFSGPLDPSGTLFGFLLAVVATIALVIVTLAAVRTAGA